MNDVLKDAKFEAAPDANPLSNAFDERNGDHDTKKELLAGLRKGDPRAISALQEVTLYKADTPETQALKGDFWDEIIRGCIANREAAFQQLDTHKVDLQPFLDRLEWMAPEFRQILMENLRPHSKLYEYIADELNTRPEQDGPALGMKDSASN